ncbi:helix-turn-helix transcriptional regulator [Marivirga sp. S37H4]|uniref:Helix-turn-helix transcriptional regulator n=1 Tax=Marivirga aurantiaca TaxID=2802615 RepID=A0A934WYZ4_9BACT|nr:AraC family transcriptional regulator [Marivirga aurantiaca]MBK6265370.1 helix-turn-helix transcriptional regulator [Marivirga aurantiaca]
MKLHIKNMVCDRCVMVVRSELEKLELNPIAVNLGAAEFSEELSKAQIAQIGDVLKPIGFELIDNKKSRLIEEVKNSIIHLIHKENNQLKSNLSEYLSHQLEHDYDHLRHLFSEVEGTTIEKFYINQKIEKVKELLVYDELNLNEITYRLNYSSVAHLSAQFKKVTGFTPSYFKKIKENKRISIDKL